MRSHTVRNFSTGMVEFSARTLFALPAWLKHGKREDGNEDSDQQGITLPRARKQKTVFRDLIRNN